MTERSDRILIHGPCLQDLTDLLYFDKIVYPVTQAIIRPVDMQPGYAGYPAAEPVPEAIRERLTEAMLFIAPGTLVFALPSADDLVAMASTGPEGLEQWTQSQGAEWGKIAAEIFLGSLDLPAGDAEVTAWLQSLDAKAKTLADYAVKLGKRSVSKLYAEDLHRTLEPGWDSVLSIRFEGMPCAVPGRPEVEDLIVFLNDEATRAKRAALFDWHRGIETEVQDGRTTMDEVPGRIETLLTDYTGWLIKSGLFAGARPVELLLIFEDWFVEGLADVARQRDGRGPLVIEKRGLNLNETENLEASREIAYVSHTHRDWRSWFPMVM